MSAESFNLLVWGWIALAFIVVPLELKVTAPYGRHTKSGWGPMIDNRLGWIIMEIPSWALMTYFFFTHGLSSNTVITVLYACWSIHYINRFAIFPLRTRTKGKKMPVVIMLFAIFFNIGNGFVNGYFLAHFAEYTNAWLSDPRFIAGIAIFATGFFINQKSDTMLINLRKPGETGYKIPKGWLFERISCPNHFGEVVEWAGFALMAWSLPAASFAIWTAANLIPRALSHHKWYLDKFPDYPHQRKAVIPYIL